MEDIYIMIGILIIIVSIRSTGNRTFYDTVKIISFYKFKEHMKMSLLLSDEIKLT